MYKIQKFVVTIFIGVLITSCGNVTPVPIVTETVAQNLVSPTASILPSPTIKISQTATPKPLPTCTPLPDLYIYVIDESVYLSDAGIELGATGAIRVLREVLDAHHPEWAQEDELVEYVWDSSHTQNIGINPRVILVTAGISLDWQVTEGNNLLEDISIAGVALTQHYREFRFNEELQSDYSQVANAASYALYAFFDFDLEKLNAWQQEYEKMFGELQPRIDAQDCQTVIVPTAKSDFCNLANSQGSIQIISGLRFTALEPGSPTLFDQILIDQNPAWTDFQQDVHGEIRSAGVVFHETAFGPELGTGINPAVLLVTYGVERDWELPANGDLVSEVDGIRSKLHQYELEWILKTVDQSQYPVANAATYASYRYFNGDLSKLEDWCRTYVQVYGESPLD